MKSIVIRIVAIVCALIFVIVIGIAFAGYKKVNNTVKLLNPIDKEEVKEMTNQNISQETIQTLKENWTIALFGIDSREYDNLSSSNSDTIMIASINNKTGDIKIISVYRDTCLKTGENRYRKVNEAYAIGGPSNAVQVLNENLDLQIDDYIAVNWTSVATAINILGGIEMDVTDAELKWINGYITETVKSTGIGSTQLTKSGLQKLDGVQAVAYSRIRYTSGNDFKRTERQRIVLNAVLNKAKKSDWSIINNVIGTVLPMIASSIDTNDLFYLGKNIFKYHFSETEGFPFEHIEKRVDGADYVFPNNLIENVSKLHDFLYATEQYIPSEKVNKISDKIDEKRNGNNYNKTKREVEIQKNNVETIISDMKEETETIESIEDNIMETINMEPINQDNRMDGNYGPGVGLEAKNETIFEINDGERILLQE